MIYAKALVRMVPVNFVGHATLLAQQVKLFGFNRNSLSDLDCPIAKYIGSDRITGLFRTKILKNGRSFT